MTLHCIQQPHQHLRTTLDQGILTLAIQRPEAKNALYGELYLWIAAALDEADQSKDVRVVILRGADADFTAGNDMQDFMKFVQTPVQGKSGDAPPFVLLKAAARFSKPLIAALLQQYIQQSDVLVDCSDNAKTRQLINRYAVQTQTPLVSASVIQFSGQVMVFDSRLSHSPCYACMFPDLGTEDKSCTQNGVFSPLVHIIGAAQAAETIKILTGLGDSSVGQFTQFEGLNFETQAFQLSRNLDCPVCGKQT